MPSSGCSLGGSPEVEAPPVPASVPASVVAVAVLEVSSSGSAVSEDVFVSASGVSVEPEPIEASVAVAAAVVGATVVNAVVAGSSPVAHPVQRPVSSHTHRFTR